MTDIDPLKFSPEEKPALITRIDTVDGPYYSESTDSTAPLLPGGAVIGIGIKRRGEETFGSYNFEQFHEHIEQIYEHVEWFDGDDNE